MLPEETQIVSLDLKVAYLLVLIFEEHIKFLHFQWHGIYEFTALLFNLFMAPYIFIKNSATNSYIYA